SGPMADQRDRILDATLSLMARAGAHGTSMRAVASACGLNVATLYHYFPSKRDLLPDAIHGDDDVFQPLLETANAFEHALAAWLRELCPDAPGLHDAAVVRAIRN